MRLLASALPEIRRLLPSGHGLVTITFACLLVGLELTGRLAASDLHDALAAVALASGVALLAARHRRQPIPWINWLNGRLVRLAGMLDRVRYEHGIDLRGDPRLPRKLPPAVWIILGVLFAWAAMASAAWLLFPNGWRDVGARTSYVAYLVVLLVVWSGLLVCTFVGAYIPYLIFDRLLNGSFSGPHQRGLVLGFAMLYVVSVLTIATLVPAAVVLGLCLGIAALAVVFVVKSADDEPAILWRSGPEQPLYAVPLRRIVAGGLGLMALVAFDLLLTACGGRLVATANPTDTMPVTTLLGTIAAWMIPGLVVVAGLRLWAARDADPARRTPPTVHIRSDRTADELRRVIGAFTNWGWRIRAAGRDVKPREVGIELVPADKSEATEFDPHWPLKVAANDVLTGQVRERLERRDEIQVRRQAFRGLSSLFKRAAAERGVRGGGYWFAPHWWFITGLDREEPHRGRATQPTPPRPVGPPYHRALGPRARQHFHKMLRAVQVDMIFVEDGVSYRTFEKVLRALFELYDMHGGKRKAEDQVFRGVPKVRVMVHEYAPGQPFKAGSGYKEPQFDDLSRARVLHIFRDHGGHEAPTETPFDFSWEPAPALGMG